MVLHGIIGAFSNNIDIKKGAFSDILHGLIGAFSNNTIIKNGAFSDRFNS